MNIGSEDFTKGEPFQVIKEDLSCAWSGGKNGIYFRCGLCGYKFQEGDIARWQFTNDVTGAGGNLFVCQKCDGTKDEVVERFIALKNEFKSEKFWYFRREGRS